MAHSNDSLGRTGAFAELMSIRNGTPIIADEIKITGQDPLFFSPFRIGETTADVLAARAVAANDLWELRTGRRQSIEIDVRAAAATSLSGGDITQKKNKQGIYEPIPYSVELKHMISLTQPWQTADHQWLLPHTNLPHLEQRILDILKCESTPESIAEGISKWNADELEDVISEQFACGGKVRTPEEWLAHPHGAYLALKPVVEITKIAESEPVLLPEGDYPASGIKVLDLTRILAGPSCGLGFAEYGADVLMVTSPELPQVPAFVRDTSHGKRSCFLDFKHQEQAQKLRELIKDADVFIDGYRPDRLAAHGFGANDIFKLKPGIIHVSVNCFGSGGPFASRAGWDQVAQAVTGICHTQGEATKAGQPKLTPVFMCDFMTGFLGTFGALIALARRAKEGGSYQVQVSLCQSAMLLQRQGLIEGFENASGRLTAEEFEQYAVFDDNTVYGDLKSFGPVVRMSETSPKWFGTTPELGSNRAEWL